jgi:hypothetical protein
LTERGIDLAPLLMDLLIRGARHEKTGLPEEVLTRWERNREDVLAEVGRRWAERDPRPMLPEAAGGATMRNQARGKERG